MQHLTTILFIAAWALVALTYAGKWLWQRRSNTPAATAIQFHSDQDPPPGTREFNLAIVEACGHAVSPDFKLAMLTRSTPLTIAMALREAREQVEKSSTPTVAPGGNEPKGAKP